MTKAKAKPNTGPIERSPVVVIMGHIDHGKSTLLDYIRKSNITMNEAGGITQHLGAYEVVHKASSGKEGKITFLDTPGHEAFSSIRERGAHVADIAVLVISAEDGVKKQTLEALEAIRDAKLPFIVAMNKIDKPGADIERTKQNLAENEIYIEGYGGDTPSVPISAVTGEGVSDLLDMIMLVAEISELKANPTVPASGTVIEANLDTKKGISATLLIKDGTLSSGMFVAAEDAIAPVRILEDFLGKPLKSATFSSPVQVIGFNKVPPVGAAFASFVSKKDAESYVQAYALTPKSIASARKPRGAAVAEDVIVIPLVIKADVIGSIEGIRHELAKLNHNKVMIRLVSETIGDISESDIKSATGTENTRILGFNVKVDSKARGVLERSGVEVKTFDIIYKLVEYVDELAKSKIPKTKVEESLGKAKILQVFSKDKDRQIVGGKVQEGVIKVGAEVKILRRDVEIGYGRIKELQQAKKREQEVREGFEFGTMIESKIEISQGDKIEAFQVIEK